MKYLGPLFVLILICSYAAAQANVTRTLSGVIVTQQDEVLQGVTISVSYQSGEQTAFIHSKTETAFADSFSHDKSPRAARIDILYEKVYLPSTECL